MKTKIHLLFVLFVMAVMVNAQTKNDSTSKIGIGGMIGLPTGVMSTGYNLAYGFDLKAEFGVAPNLAITLSAGYLNWVGKSGYGGTTSLIPALGGLKCYFSDKVYGSAEAGLSFSTNSGGGNAFTFSPGVGYKVTDKFDVMLKYQDASKNGVSIAHLGLRAGLTF